MPAAGVPLRLKQQHRGAIGLSPQLLMFTIMFTMHSLLRDISYGWIWDPRLICGLAKATYASSSTEIESRNDHTRFRRWSKAIAKLRELPSCANPLSRDYLLRVLDACCAIASGPPGSPASYTGSCLRHYLVVLCDMRLRESCLPCAQRVFTI